MTETNWRLKLITKGAREAKALARELRELDAALKSVGESAHVLKSLSADAQALRGAKVRVQAERRVGDESVRAQERTDRARRQSVEQRRRDDEGINRAAAREERREESARAQRRRDDAGINSASDRAARDDARVARQLERSATAARTQRRRDDEGIARAGARADREDARGIQRIAGMNAGAFRRDQAMQVQQDRRQQRSVEQLARLNSQAFKKDGVEQTRQSQRRERDATRSLATNRREWHEAQQARSEGWGDLLKAGGMVLGVMGALSAATIGALSFIADMAGAFGRLAFGIGNAVLQMVAFRESTITTLRVMARGDHGQRLTGDAANRQAHEQFGFAQQFARETPLNMHDVLDLQRQTTAAGFHGAENRQVVMAAADVGALRQADDPTAARRFLLQLGQMRGATSMRTRDFRPAAEAAGLQENDVLRATARESHKAGAQQRHGESDAAYNGRLQGMLSHGGFTGQQGVAGFRAAIRDRNGGPEGTFARSQSAGLMATLSNVQDAVEAFVTSVGDIENLPGILALKNMLNGVVDALTGAGPLAGNLRTIFGNIVNDAGLFVASLGGPGGAQGLIASALETAQRLWPFVRDISMAFGGAAWESFKTTVAPLLTQLGGLGSDSNGTVAFARELGRDLGIILGWGVRIITMFGALAALLVVVGTRLAPLIDGIASIITGLANLPLRLSSAFSGSGNIFAGLGASIVNGFRNGFGGSRDGAVSDVATWSNDLADASRDRLDVHSPSRVFRDIGLAIPAGMSMGIDSGARDVERSLAGMVAPQGLPGFGGVAGGGLAGLGGGGGVSAVFNIVVQGGGSNEETGREIGEASWAAFVDRFERAGAMQGA